MRHTWRRPLYNASVGSPPVFSLLFFSVFESQRMGSAQFELARAEFERSQPSTLSSSVRRRSSWETSGREPRVVKNGLLCLSTKEILPRSDEDLVVAKMRLRCRTVASTMQASWLTIFSVNWV